jgi:hypothetical protein
MCALQQRKESVKMDYYSTVWAFPTSESGCDHDWWEDSDGCPYCDADAEESARRWAGDYEYKQRVENPRKDV